MFGKAYFKVLFPISGSVYLQSQSTSTLEVFCDQGRHSLAYSSSAVNHQSHLNGIGQLLNFHKYHIPPSTALYIYIVWSNELANENSTDFPQMVVKSIEK